MPLTIGLTFDLKQDYPQEISSAVDDDCELDSPETIDAIASALEKSGHRVFKLGGGRNLLQALEIVKPDIVFNISEGLYGRNREAQVPSILEMHQTPYTGSDPLTLSICLDKSMSKKIVSYSKIPTPVFEKVEEVDDIYRLDELDFEFPLFIKPCYEGSSKGIRLDSKIKNISTLKEKTLQLLGTYRQPVLIEEYLPGPEFTVGVLGNKKPEIVGIMEVRSLNNHNKELIYSYEVKKDWENQVQYLCPPPISPKLMSEIKKVALDSYKALECRDVARIDIRLDKHGAPNFLEVNPLPGLMPGYSDLYIMAKSVGMDYDVLVNKILSYAVGRYPHLRINNCRSLFV